MRIEKHLRFDPRTTPNYWESIANALESIYPNITWGNGTELRRSPREVATIFVCSTPSINTRQYYISYSSSFYREDQWTDIRVPKPVDGYIWVKNNTIDYDKTSDMFNSLNESKKKSEHAWMFNHSLVGIKFYEPNEYNDVGTIYTIDGEKPNGVLVVSWVNEKGYNYPEQITTIDKDGFIEDLDRKYLKILFNGDNIFDTLNESEDLEWAQDVVSNASNVVTYTQLYKGMKILPGGPDWIWGSQGKRATYGTIELYGGSDDEVYGLEGDDMEDENGGYWTQVTWRHKNGQYLDSNNYRVGPKYFDLLHYLGSTDLNEGHWDEVYKTKRYTQKFNVGDRVVMNGTVGGKTLTNELGTVLKFKHTGGGTGHPHRVYLILFDNWNDKKNNFLMSSAQADQNREFIDARCREGSCWYTTSDNLEPAPDSNELFSGLNESEEKYGNINLTGLSYKVTQKNDPQKWVLNTIISDNGKVVEKTLEPSESMRDFIGDYVQWDNIIKVPKEAIIKSLYNSHETVDLVIITMPGSTNYNFFDSLNESEEDDLEWARDTIKVDPLIRPGGRMPRKGDRIRITSKNREWMDNYEQCFENPFDITVTVLQVLPKSLEVSTTCLTGEFDVEFYVPFEVGAHARAYQDMDRFGIKIYPI